MKETIKGFFLCIAVIMMLFFTGCKGVEQKAYNTTLGAEIYSVDNTQNSITYEVNSEDDDENQSNNVFIIILLLITGIWNSISPKSSWYLSHGWKYKDAEPSEIYLVLARIGGIAAIIIAIVLMFI